MSYLPHLKDEIMSSIFRAKRDGMHVKKRNSNGTLQKTNKVSWQRTLHKKIKDDHYKETWQICRFF